MVLTRDRLGRLLRSRWLFAAVVLAMVLGALVLSQSRQRALAADTRGATQAVSVGNNNVIGTAASDSPSISTSGRYVAFRTDTAFDSLDRQNDEGGDSDIYVRDTVAGTTTLVSPSVGDGDPSPSDGTNFQPSISGDGRYVAFVTRDQGILNMSADFVEPTVVICDRGAPNASGAFNPGCTYTNLGSGGIGVVFQSDPVIARNGNRLRVAFLDSSRAVVAQLSLDPTSGAIGPPAFSEPPIAPPVGGRTGHNDFDVTLSSNGRYLVRVTQYVDTTENLPSVYTVLANDLDGDPAAPAARVDFATPTTFVNNSIFLEEVAVSGDGRRIAFTEVTGGEPPLIVHAVDRDPDGDGNFGPGSGANRAVAAEVASSDASGQPVGGRTPAFSGDGRYLAFATDAAIHNGLDDSSLQFTCIHEPPIESPGAFTRPLDGPRLRLVADTGRSNCDVVVRDLVQDAQRKAAGLPRLPAELASPSQQSTLPGTNPAVTCPTVCEGDGDSTDPVLDGDGSAVAYASLADNLLVNGADNNKVSDVFKRTFKPLPVVAPLDLGDVVVHTLASGTVTVSYSGMGPLQITAVNLGGTNAGDFAVTTGETCTGAVLHAGDTCVVPIRFTPGDLGTRTGTLTVTTNTGVRATGTLTGNGVPEPPPRTPVFQATPDPLAFGAQQPFVPSAAKTVTVTNTGTGPLNITNVVTAGANPGDYAISANTCGIPVDPGKTCTVSVTFAPQAITDRPALLQFTDNAAGSPHVVALTGNGTRPTLVASPPLNRSGAVSQISGTGWVPNKVVVVTLLNTPIQVSVTASATGTFTVPLVIFPHTPLGKKQLQAQVQTVPGITATIDYLVVPGSQLPPDFAERR